MCYSGREKTIPLSMKDMPRPVGAPMAERMLKEDETPLFTAKNYVRATCLQEAYDLNQKRANAILGGGCWMKMGARSIGTLIDLSGLDLDQIQEEEDCFTLGAMVTLRQMETHAGLCRALGPALKKSLRHIVGVQFRNCATLGGTLYSRFGFSDVLTLLLALDCQVQLVGAGLVPLEVYAQQPYDRDVLSHLHIKKNGRKVAYESFRNTQTDLPVLTCALSTDGQTVRTVVGARPGRAKRSSMELALGATEKEVADYLQVLQKELRFDGNLRGSEAYRRHLCGVLFRRALGQLREGM